MSQLLRSMNCLAVKKDVASKNLEQKKKRNPETSSTTVDLFTNYLQIYSATIKLPFVY